MVWLRVAMFATATVFGMGVLSACGSDDGNKKDDTSTSKPAVTWTEVNTIVKASCTGSGCHGTSGASSTIYEDNEANFKKTVTVPDRLNSTNSALKMPQPPKTISDADKQKLIDFINQK